MTKRFDKAIDDLAPTFCAIPFVSMMVNTDATIRPCCIMKRATHRITDENGSAITIQQNLESAWNSKEMRDIRLNMINGKSVEGCSVCYLQEASGRTSNRQHANAEWGHKLGFDHMFKLVDRAITHNGELDYEIAYLDLRLGTLCNLKCRMCSPFNSSQIAKEHLDLEQRDERYRNVWIKSYGKFDTRILDVQEWFDRDTLWDQIIDLIPKLEKVYMTGGEPTLIENNFRFMSQCIERGRKDILLFFNTNCTNVNSKFLDLISQFDCVNINASVDGVGQVNDYIRFPSKWKQISSNVEKLAQLPNVVLGITPTVQAYNVFDLVNMLEWVDELNRVYNRNIFVDFLINVHPHHLSVNILPDHIRDTARESLVKYLNNRDHRSLHELTLNSVKGIIGLLEKPRVDDWQEQISRFRDYTLSLDVERQQQLETVSEELAKLLNES